MSKYEKGKIVTGYVTGIEKYGIFVDLDEYYNGLIHISEISNGFVKSINDYVNVGETIKVRILDRDDESCQVKLSIKDVDYRLSKKKRIPIQETSTGFDTLEKKLDSWIEYKTQEIKQKQNVDEN